MGNDGYAGVHNGDGEHDMMEDAEANGCTTCRDSKERRCPIQRS